MALYAQIVCFSKFALNGATIRILPEYLELSGICRNFVAKLQR
jgi:hypothetical protein